MPNQVHRELTNNPQKRVYHCFGCNTGGDIISFIQKVGKIDFPEIITYLKRLTGDTSPAAQKVEQPVTPVKQRVAGITLNDIAGFYEKGLGESKEAQTYLAETRGIKNSAIYHQHKIGFADGTLLQKVGSKRLEDLKTLGLLTEKGKERFTGCIVIPLYDETNRVAGLYGRKIKGKGHHNIDGPLKGIFNQKAATVYKTIMSAK